MSYKNMITEWNVLSEYDDGDIVIKGDQVMVYSKGIFYPVEDSRDIEYDACCYAVDQYHKDKNLPSYDEIMRVFYEARPEYKL